MYRTRLGTLNHSAILYRFSAKPAARNISNMINFKSDLWAAHKIVILSGAGISAESGIPTYRVGGNKWRNHQSTALATPEAFKENPGLVWEFYHFRREQILLTKPNTAHKAIVDYEKRHKTDKEVVVLTQNIDNLHNVAGSRTVIELHGNIFKTRCTKCKDVQSNFDSPLCEALANRGDPKVKKDLPHIPVKLLPHCKKENCKGLLRPHVLWFGENLESAVLEKAEKAIDTCNMCLVIGTSSVVYPAALFAPKAAEKGAIVAEFNIESSPTMEESKYYFKGPCGETLPKALSELTFA